jgi:hypothetical protein
LFKKIHIVKKGFATISDAAAETGCYILFFCTKLQHSYLPVGRQVIFQWRRTLAYRICNELFKATFGAANLQQHNKI